jgi:predicted DNA-binding transcriptional regulator YafY
MPTRLRRQVDALRAMTVSAPWEPGGPEIDPATLTTAAQACRDAERLAFAYTAADGVRTERTVEPHRLVALGRRWYLVAYDLTRHDWRSFRLDRLEGLRREGSRFRPRALPDEDAAAFVRRGTTHLPTTYDVHAVLAAPADEVRRRTGRWAAVEELDDDRCRLTMRTDSLDWAALALGSVAAELSELSPPELVEHLRRWADRFQRATAGPAR